MKFRTFGKLVAMGGASVLLLGWCLGELGMRVNTSNSVPVGVYWVERRPIQAGSYVMFCPPVAEIFDVARDRGYINGGACPGGYGFMIKRVFGTAGDRVSVTDDGVDVNGIRVPASRPRRVDPDGERLPVYRAAEFRLGGDEILVMSGVNDLSFDGRYFGAIARGQVRDVVRPVMIFWPTGGN